MLTTAVDSALSQTAKEIEVLVVDDGSIRAVSLPNHPRLRVVRHLRSRGLSAARNLGTALAATPLVAFLDDDDVLRPQMIESSLTALQRADVPAPAAVISAIAVTNEPARSRRFGPPLHFARRGHISRWNRGSRASPTSASRPWSSRGQYS